MKTTSEESKEIDRLMELSDSKNPYDKKCPNRHLWSEGFRNGLNYAFQQPEKSVPLTAEEILNEELSDYYLDLINKHDSLGETPFKNWIIDAMKRFASQFQPNSLLCEKCVFKVNYDKFHDTRILFERQLKEIALPSEEKISTILNSFIDKVIEKQIKNGR